MSGGARTLRWAPPLLVGICGACAAEVAVGLLLYAGPGFMRSLTTVLAVEAGALGAGLWTAPSPRPDLVEAVRRRWMVCLVAFVIAALFSAFWSLVQTVGGSPLGQGLGLAFTAGLPLYSCGTVLGGLSSVEGSIASGGRRIVGAAAALGAAIGFAGTGASLPYLLTPASLLLVCLVLLSAGGLAFASVLDASQPDEPSVAAEDEAVSPWSALVMDDQAPAENAGGGESGVTP